MRYIEWNPIRGCSFVSPGCANCAGLAAADEGLKSGRKWSGVTRQDASQAALPDGLPATCAIFVCNHGDLFHEATPDAWISEVFATMERNPHHHFQVLTKRAARMRTYVVARYGGVAGPPHIALGVSAERQEELDDRGADLTATPGLVRYVTLYPLLGEIDLSRVLDSVVMVSAGDEPQRRADPAWFASAERQCAARGVPFIRAALLGEAA